MITYVDYSISEAINQFKGLIVNYPIIYYIFLAAIVLGIIIMVNLNTKNAFYTTLVIELLALVFTFYYRGLDLIEYIDTIFNQHFYQNIFFYYWNVLIGLLIMHLFINGKSDKVTKIIIILSYILTIANLIYSFYITNIVGNNYTLVVGNIAPIIILGNITLFVTYLYLIILKTVEACKKKNSIFHTF